ncbi:MAG: hypothetical protein F7C35_00765 [Desulfurococcales archaeon]|nr:hypothetical protein [Desulfurococcales archaeon]
MSVSWISPRSVAGRILLALGLSLFLGGVAGYLLGVKTVTTMSGSLELTPNSALVVSTYTLTSRGVVTVEAWNASEVYYVSGIRGDPRSLLKGLQTFNISVGNEDFKTDLRLGVVYGTTTAQASGKLLSVLPQVSTMLSFKIIQVKPVSPDHYIVRQNLTVNEALLVFIVGQNVTYKYTYQVGEHHIIDPEKISALGAVLSASSLLFLPVTGRSRGRG